MSTDLTDAKPAAVDELTRADFGMWVEIPGHGRGYLYAIHDDFNDGYPSRMVVLVADDGSTAAEMEFTDSDPAGYPKTMHTPCVVTDEPPEVRCPTCESPFHGHPCTRTAR